MGTMLEGGEGGVGSWLLGVGVGEAKRLVYTSWLIHVGAFNVRQLALTMLFSTHS